MRSLTSRTYHHTHRGATIKAQPLSKFPNDWGPRLVFHVPK